MLVVSDATPLQVLIRLGHADILRTLYQHVVIPPAVAAELSHPNTPSDVRAWLAAGHEWLRTQSPSVGNSPEVSGAGEREAIRLALELGADYLLVDDLEARTVARQLGIRIIGTIGILDFADARGLLQIRPAIERLREIGFYIDEAIIAQILNRRT